MSKRMTANPVKPARHRAGKVAAEDSSSDEEASEVEEPQLKQPPPLKTSSFSSSAAQVASSLKKVDIAAHDRQVQVEAEELAKRAEEEGFVTEESSDAGDDDEDASASSSGEDGSDSGSEESSSEDEAPKKFVRPLFIRKDQRNEAKTSTVKSEDQRWEEEEAQRRQKADAMIQEQLEKEAAAKAGGFKDWDDDEGQEEGQVDDTDGIDPETERAAWKLRELKRVKREREAIEAAEREREEVERRRNLTKEEREAEDKEYIDLQKEQREGKGKMSYMQKYFHKGAFFQDDAKAAGLADRDLMGSRIADDVSNREILPEFMQIRDMTKLGKKGRTKYKDMRSEDTGQWGREITQKQARGYGVDERFQPDRPEGRERSGANTAPLGQRRDRQRSSDRDRRKRSRSPDGSAEKRRRIHID